MKNWSVLYIPALPESQKFYVELVVLFASDEPSAFSNCGHNEVSYCALVFFQSNFFDVRSLKSSKLSCVIKLHQEMRCVPISPPKIKEGQQQISGFLCCIHSLLLLCRANLSFVCCGML